MTLITEMAANELACVAGGEGSDDNTMHLDTSVPVNDSQYDMGPALRGRNKEECWSFDAIGSAVLEANGSC